jgi:hypothetical protein
VQDLCDDESEDESADDDEHLRSHCNFNELDVDGGMYERKCKNCGSH